MVNLCRGDNVNYVMTNNEQSSPQQHKKVCTNNKDYDCAVAAALAAGRGGGRAACGCQHRCFEKA